jgi:chromosome segregation ATPase
VDLPGLQAVLAAAQRELDQIANAAPGTGLLARLGGAVARHEEALGRARRTEAAAAAAVQAAQRQAEQEAIRHYLPKLQAEVQTLTREVGYWRRRSERLQRELAAARAIEARPAADAPAERDEEMADGEYRQRPPRQRAG